MINKKLRNLKGCLTLACQGSLHFIQSNACKQKEEVKQYQRTRLSVNTEI